jgi:hypothetical protein
MLMLWGLCATEDSEDDENDDEDEEEDDSEEDDEVSSAHLLTPRITNAHSCPLFIPLPPHNRTTWIWMRLIQVTSSHTLVDEALEAVRLTTLQKKQQRKLVSL